MPAVFQRRMRVLVRQSAPGIDWDAAVMDRRMFTMTEATMYGLTRGPHEGKGKGKGKGILPIMDASGRANL